MLTGSSLEKIIFSITKDTEKEVQAGQSEDSKWSGSSHKTLTWKKFETLIYLVFFRGI